MASDQEVQVPFPVGLLVDPFGEGMPRIVAVAAVEVACLVVVAASVDPVTFGPFGWTTVREGQ